MFHDFRELVEMAEVSTALKVLVDLVTAHDPIALAHCLRALPSSEEGAFMVASTAHKAKGREWDQVVLWEDFPSWWDTKGEVSPEEENLFYVAMARARKRLTLTHLPAVIDVLGEHSSLLPIPF